MKVFKKSIKSLYEVKFKPSPPKILRKCIPNDSFKKTLVHTIPQKGLDLISGIKKGLTGGTVCDGSIGMRNFWAMFNMSEIKSLKQRGISTNDESIPNTFLKSKSENPLSTSAVRDCSVMYLYNDKTKTHSMYHAANDCSSEALDFYIKNLMPEGFTHGAIIPGRSFFCEDHKANMKNMFCTMKINNPDSIVNVYHSSTELPEIVGYEGCVYEIPNKKFLEKGKDEGQASFEISDISGGNTFMIIGYNFVHSKQIEKFRQQFKNMGFDFETVKVFNRFLDIRARNLRQIENCKTLEELGALNNKLDTVLEENNYWTPIFDAKEKILIRELNKIEDFQTFRKFYHRVRKMYNHSQMKKLHDRMHDKEIQLLKGNSSK